MNPWMEIGLDDTRARAWLNGENDMVLLKHAAQVYTGEGLGSIMPGCWTCEHWGMSGMGGTPREAYEDWHREMKERLEDVNDFAAMGDFEEGLKRAQGDSPHLINTLPTLRPTD